LLSLLVLQLLLGFGSYAAKVPLMGILLPPVFREAITVAHVATGGLMLALSLVTTLIQFQSLDRHIVPLRSGVTKQVA
jgi:hypothetical protein